MRSSREKGQVLAIVIVVLMVITALVPVLVFYAQRESIWTNKQARSTTAFHMAEAGIEKGYLAISISTQNWVQLQNGTLMTDYKFDKSYSDVSGGFYTISITSGPLAQEATVISIGKDNLSKETRSIRAVYANATLGNVAIMGGSGVDVTGNNLTVEWGAIVSPNAITTNGDHHPSYWSAAGIDLDTNGSTPPNCDSPNCWWWHSYYSGIPALPTIDFNFYKSSAQASGNAPCGMTYYQSGSASGACSSTNGKPFYVQGSWTGFDGPVVGSVIVMGSVSTPNGSMSGQAVTANVPQQAWKQYCNDWSYYLTTYNTDSWLSTNFPSQCPGLYSSYLSPSNMTYSITPVVNGLLYTGGDFTGPNGGGNTTIAYGVLVVSGHVYLNSNSHCKYYYNAATSQSLQTTTINLSRQSWKDEIWTWPTGL